MKFAFISQEKVAYPVALLCRVMEVSTSGYYAAQGRPASPRTLRDAELGVHVAAAHEASKRRYGSPRVHAELQAQGQRVARKRVARLMRREEARSQEQAPFPSDYRLSACIPHRAQRPPARLHRRRTG